MYIKTTPTLNCYIANLSPAEKLAVHTDSGLRALEVKVSQFVFSLIVAALSSNYHIHPKWLVCYEIVDCAMYLLLLDLVSKSQISTNQNLFKARANSQNDRWICIIPLNMLHRLA